MSIENRVEELIDLLIQGTTDGSLQWEGTADENAFRLASPTANVRVTRFESYDREEEAPFDVRKLSVLNNRGRVIEQFYPSTPLHLGKFDTLFVEARRSASNTGEVLDKLMKELRQSVS